MQKNKSELFCHLILKKRLTIDRIKGLGDTDVIIFRSSLKLDSSPKNFKIVLTFTFLKIEANNKDPFSLFLASTSKRFKS